MKILVRLPNWLGDMVMSVGFMNQLPCFFPGAQVSVIVKKGIHELLDFFPEHQHRFVFDKKENPGFGGLIKFGKMIRETDSFDHFFCLPDSLSSAMMGKATGSKRRIGYKKELRQIFLTHSFTKPKDVHRVEEYVRMLTLYTKKPELPIDVSLRHTQPKQDYLVVNINSEASSRRLTVTKAVEVLTVLRNRTDRKIILIGAPKEKEFVNEVISSSGINNNMENMAGKTSLTELALVLAGAHVMLSTDSGPAHLANALGTPVVVLFGAGNEKNTAPYTVSKRTIIRLGQLSCEPCQKNVCARYAVPQCLEQLNTSLIADNIFLF